MMPSEIDPELQPLTSLHLRDYGRTARPPVPHQCCASVLGADAWLRSKQCSRLRGYGPERAYCKQHDPEAVKARQAKEDEAYRVRSAVRAKEHAGPRLFAALEQIADGHNDPRALAAEAIASLRKSGG